MEFSEDWEENQRFINELPEFKEDIDYPEEVIPKFANWIIKDASIEDDSKYEFVRRFLLYYLTYESFKKIVDNWVFLFVYGKYYGVYKYENDAVNFGKNFSKNQKGIYLIPMRPEIIKMRNETKSISIGTRYKEKHNGKIYDNIAYNDYYVDISLGNKNRGNITPLITSCKYLVDTGCNRSYIPECNYFDLIKYEYSDLPFDENNQIIYDESLRRPDLLNLNKDGILLHKVLTEVADCNNKLIPKMKIYIGDDIKIILNDKLNCDVLSLMSHSIYYEYIDEENLNTNNGNNSSNKTIFGKLSKYIGRKKKEKRNITGQLMGLDIFNQFETSTEEVFKDMHVMKFTYPKRKKLNITYNFPTLNGKQSIYEVYMIKYGTSLYLKTEYQIGRDYNNIDLLNLKFNLSDQLLFSEYNIDEFGAEYISNKTLNLVFVQFIDDYNELFSKIVKNENLDGYITRSRKNPHSLQIYIKYNDSIKFVSKYLDYNSKFEILKTYDRNIDYESINKNKLAIWYLNFDLEFPVIF